MKIQLAIIITLTLVISLTSLMAEKDSESSVYIVYTQSPSDGVDPESFHLRTLSSVLGSEEAAKESLIYVYKNAATGFSAKLTKEQVSELEKQPGVVQVVRSQTLKLHQGPDVMKM